MTQPTWITPGEAAEILGYKSSASLARHAKAGRLRVQRTLGQHRRYSLEDVQRLAAEHHTPEGAA